jgi:hypothetical protein
MLRKHVYFIEAKVEDSKTVSGIFEVNKRMTCDNDVVDHLQERMVAFASGRRFIRFTQVNYLHSVWFWQ